MNKSLIKNASIMYGRMLILMIANLYISRLALNYLGVEKFGLMSVIAGLVIIGAFLSTILETTAQRYISESLVLNNTNELVKTIQSLIYVYGVIVTISMIIVEVFGGYYVNSYLNQNILNSNEINWIFQISVATFFSTSLSSILLAILIAFENVKLYSIVTLFEVGLKLFLINFLLQGDGNIVYYLFILLISIIASRLYALYFIKNKYPEIKFLPKKNILLVKKIFFFVKWNLIGGFASVATVQGLNVVINIYQGLTVNAARAIAMQLNLSIIQMINSIQLVFNPRITKLYISGDFEVLNGVFQLNAKLTAIFSALIIIGINSQLDWLLETWLGTYPPILNGFVYFMLIEMYFASFTGPLLSVVQASEKIKFYQVLVGGTMLLNVPLCYIMLGEYNNPLIIYYVPICITILCFIQRLYFVSKLKVIRLNQYIQSVFIRVTLFLVASLYMQSLINQIKLDNNLIEMLIHGSSTILLLLIIGINSIERKIIFEYIKKIYT